MRATGLSTLADWLTRLETLHPKKIDMSLDRIRQVLAALGLAHPPYRVITVGGTNGKGSCVALLESIYSCAGYRVGAFTSPHLWRFNERIRCNGEEAADEVLIGLFEQIEAARGAVTLSYFEFSATAAFLHFAHQRADIAVLEVGLGGRLDAVNAIDADAALIASIDLDHQEWLGPDRESVGREKAGILRAGCAAVIADRDPPASVFAHAADIGADLRVIGRQFDFSAPRQPEIAAGDRGPETTAGSAAEADTEPPGGHWCFVAGARTSIADLPRPVFGGDVQLANAAACVAVVDALQPMLPVPAGALREGLRSARLHARLERRQIHEVEWLFDVAHNPAAARELGAALQRLPRARRTLAVFGAMHDKNLAGVLAPFVSDVDEWFVVQADAQRGATPAAMLDVLAGLGARHVRRQPDIATACRSAQLRAAAGDRILVFGSFYLVGPAMTALGLYCAPIRSDQSAKWTGV